MDSKTLALGATVLGGGYLATRGSAAGTDDADAPTVTENNGASDSDFVEGGGSGSAATVVDTDTGVTYSDPRTEGSATFEDANTNDTEIDDTDPTSYAPDDGGPISGDAPDSGTISDPGDSQEWGSAPEAEDDDLNDAGNFGDSTQSAAWGDAFDRLANADTVEDL